MKINMIVVGKTKSQYIHDGEEDYLKRVKRYIGFEYTIIKPEKISRSRTDSSIIIAEGERIQQRVQSNEYTVALDSGGLQFSSAELAGSIQKRMNAACQRLNYVIGGPLGLSESILNAADAVLSLSKMTLTHEIARLILLEQIYRAFTILNGEKYHK